MSVCTPSSAPAGQGSAEGADPSIRTEDLLRAPLTPATVKATYLAWVEAHWFERWARDATRLALDLTRERPYDVVITSGPPHVAHEVGYRVATKPASLRRPSSSSSSEQQNDRRA